MCSSDLWDALLARLRRAPIMLGSTAVTYTQLVTEVGDALLIVQPFTTPVTNGGAQGWSGAAQVLQELWTARHHTPGTQLASAPAAAAARQRYPGPEQGLSVICGDAPSPPAGAFPGLQRLVLGRGGVIGLPDLWGDEPCATWPVRQVDTYRGPWNAPTSPILVIGNTTDPSTPLRDAVAMTRQLANARLLIVHGYGHTAFLNPSSCAQNYVTAYFRTGALPPNGTVCQQNRPPFAPPAG